MATATDMAAAQNGALSPGMPLSDAMPPMPNEPRPNIQPGQQPAQPQIPAPTHRQTVAALRHFSAVKQELSTLLKNPDLGKADVRSAIIDGTTKLVADRIVSAPTAVAQLATVPERPYDQKKWVETQMQQIMQARNAVIAHHAAAFAGGPPEATPSADTHQADIGGMMAAQYAGKPNA